jgi:hypothetical protein
VRTFTHFSVLAVSVTRSLQTHWERWGLSQWLGRLDPSTTPTFSTIRWVAQTHSVSVRLYHHRQYTLLRTHPSISKDKDTGRHPWRRRSPKQIYGLLCLFKQHLQTLTPFGRSCCHCGGNGCLMCCKCADLASSLSNLHIPSNFSDAKTKA